MTEQYKIFEHLLSGTAAGNPYMDIRLEAAFTDGRETVKVNGFYCDQGIYRIRFMPETPGVWTAVTSSNDPLLDNITITCHCVPAKEGNHGRVLPKNAVCPQKEDAEENCFHFAYKDGSRYQPFGTTCYAWTHQPGKIQEQTLLTLQNAPFNKVRMCIFPKFYTYNTTDPEKYPFCQDAEQGFDFTRFDPEYWEHLEHRIAQLDALGIEADLILFHPYDKWGFSKMDIHTDLLYLRYAVDRLCHFKNVWWSLANEYDLMPWKSIDDWELFARTIMNRDSYGHLRSIHNCTTLYDHTRPWITHASIQRTDVYKTAENVTEWRDMYQKPIVVDECSYEGNICYGWGNITGEEMLRRFWEGCVRGGYLTHGEVYTQYEQIWWSHGGVLHGTCPSRIAFLRKIMADAPEDAAPLRLTPQNHWANWDVPCLCCAHDNSYFLYYFGFSRPAFREYELPEGCSYEIELLDTWNMTTEKLPGLYSGSIRIPLPEKQYMAIRMKKSF